jgi:hypothetical protein
MKSIALILWLVLGNGRETFLSTQYFEDEASCTARAELIKADHAAQGKKIRFLCQRVIEEDTNVDMYGNPLPPGHADAN